MNMNKSRSVFTRLPVYIYSVDIMSAIKLIRVSEQWPPHCFSALYHYQTQILITETKPIPSKWNMELGRNLRATIKTLKVIINDDAKAFALAVQCARNTLPLRLVLWCPSYLSANDERSPCYLNKPPLPFFPATLPNSPTWNHYLYYHAYFLFTCLSSLSPPWNLMEGFGSTFLTPISRQSLTEQMIKKYVFKKERKYDCSSIYIIS